MSMIRCPECGNSISSKASVCPHCGIKSEDAAKIKNKYRTSEGDAKFVRGVIYFLIISAIFGLATIPSSRKTDTPKNNSRKSTTNSTTKTENVNATEQLRTAQLKKDAATLKPTIDELKKIGLIYKIDADLHEIHIDKYSWSLVPFDKKTDFAFWFATYCAGTCTNNTTGVWANLVDKSTGKKIGRWGQFGYKEY